MVVFSGQKIHLIALCDSFFELCFNSQSGINKFDQQTLKEINQVLILLSSTDAQGLLISSAQKVFFAGGDIDEFVERFVLPDAEVLGQLQAFNQPLTGLSQLPFPVVCAINGAALGGGVEIALASDYRLALSDIKIGFPEVSLGIIPGTGGTVRLPRLVGVENALQWICSGNIFHASDAKAIGLIDALIGDENRLKKDALTKLKELAINPDTWKKHREKQCSKVEPLSNKEQEKYLSSLRKQHAGLTLNARIAATTLIQKAAGKTMESALEEEHHVVIDLGKSDDSKKLVQKFIQS